ncbi:hypothetical protein WMY93_011587 [Mugilogobius chulae]|uniref:Cadherin N-terminal domain-containing protein n=1 Tax=Mugilogobius chulae TaxID=88201 RepID=A0AAW0PE85_9GOBI
MEEPLVFGSAGQQLAHLNEVLGRELRYSITEEQEIGTEVGDLAHDLGLDIRKLPSRKIKVTSSSGRRYVNVDSKNGKLQVKEKLDRESLCNTINPA